MAHAATRLVPWSYAAFMPASKPEIGEAMLLSSKTFICHAPVSQDRQLIAKAVSKLPNIVAMRPSPIHSAVIAQYTASTSSWDSSTRPNATTSASGTPAT